VQFGVAQLASRAASICWRPPNLVIAMSPKMVTRVSASASDRKDSSNSSGDGSATNRPKRATRSSAWNSTGHEAASLHQTPPRTLPRTRERGLSANFCFQCSPSPIYNDERPHEAIAFRLPRERYLQAPTAVQEAA
jgi:hypothetical protein